MNGHGHESVSHHFEHEFVSKSLSETDSGMRFFASDADTGVHSDTNLDLYGHEVFWTPDKDTCVRSSMAFCITVIPAIKEGTTIFYILIETILFSLKLFEGPNSDL